MSELIWLLIVFVVLNVLDGLTTWLSIYRLPESLRAREANPLFKDVERHFLNSMIRKLVLVALAFYIFIYLYNRDPGGGTFSFRVLDLVLLLVVANNFYVYISRRATKRAIQTPVGAMKRLLQRLLPERWAGVAAYYLLTGCAIVACYFLVAATL